MSRRILRYPEVSARTGIPVATLRWYRQQGVGPRTWLLGGRVVAYEDEVDEWLEQCRNRSSAGAP